MKKTSNKGFSMVELIIVIAIMAILAGALAPALIKYINKSRISSDIQTADTIGTSINTALSNEDAYDEAATKGSITASVAANLSIGKCFDAEFNSALGKNKKDLKIKSKKDYQGNSYTSNSTDFLVDVDAVNNVVKVYIGDTNHIAYPEQASSLVK